MAHVSALFLIYYLCLNKSANIILGEDMVHVCWDKFIKCHSVLKQK